MEGKTLNHVHFSRASDKDYEDIFRLQRAAYATEDALYDYTIPPMLQTQKEAAGDCERSLVLKAVAEGVIVGSIRGYQENGVCYINKLMVRPDHRRRGIGTALLRAIESKFSPERFELFTGSKSHDNIAFYERGAMQYTKQMQSTDWFI